MELLELDHPIEIVDVGANPIGEPAYADLFEAGSARVTGFEPQPSAFEKLQALRDARARFFPFAIGDGQTHELRVCRNSGFTSLLEPNTSTFDYLGRYHRPGKVLERLSVETKRLDDVTSIEHVDLLKIDIQGGELSVFQNAETALQDCVAVVTEVAFIPLYEDQPLFDDQMREMRHQGFDLHKFMFAKSLPMWSKLKPEMPRAATFNQLIDGDAVFVKDLLNINDMAPLRLKKLALLADGCFRSFDLVVRCLSCLIEQGLIKETSCKPYLEHLKQA